MKRVAVLFVAGLILYAANAFSSDAEKVVLQQTMFKNIGSLLNNVQGGTCPNFKLSFCNNKDSKHVAACETLFSSFACDANTINKKMGVASYYKPTKNQPCTSSESTKCCPLEYSAGKFIYLFVTKTVPYIKCLDK